MYITGQLGSEPLLIWQAMRMLDSVRTVGHLGGQKARKNRTTAAITIPRGHRRATLVMGVWKQSRSRVLNWTMSMTLWPVTLLVFLLKRRLEEAKPTPVIGSPAVAARQSTNTDCG